MMDEYAGMMDEYASMSDEQLDELERQAKKKEEMMQRRTPAGLKRYSKAMEGFTMKYPHHVIR